MRAGAEKENKPLFFYQVNSLPLLASLRSSHTPTKHRLVKVTKPLGNRQNDTHGKKTQMTPKSIFWLATD
jgi:hypothetical protein